MMDTREQKEARLAELKASLQGVEGTQTEVYSRIVGYYRSVRNWNAGKREEFGNRVEYDFPSAGSPALAAPDDKVARLIPTADSYIVFTREACPNCPPVKQLLESLGLAGTAIDVDTDEGLDMARSYEVLSTPTVIFLDSVGDELYRAHSGARVRELLESRAEGMRVTA
jgi:glutaredoxin